MTSKMTAKKIILCITFLIVISSITFYSIFKEISFSTIINNLTSINPLFSIICILLVILYFIFQGIYNKIIYKSLNTNITLKKGIFYSIVEYFFSGITPSSTGGQPVELFYMTKDKIPMRKSIIVLVLNTIYFKLFMLVFGIIILIFNRDLVFNNGTAFSILFFIGFIGDFLLVLACYLLSFRPKFVRKIVNIYIKFMKKFRSNKKIDESNDIVSKYQDEIIYVKTHKITAINGLLITFFQRIFLFSITFVIFKTFNLTGYNYFELLLMQIVVHMCIEFIPLPGGTGVSEYLFNHLFLNVFGLELASIGMALTRIFTFYLPLIIIMIIIIIVTNTKYIKGSKNENKNN